ncbi:MAG: preprotein translocase subunit SecE [Sulfolobaceae archaeon]|nr:preprotein translocase subunit SecE [Sulfolobaceae archaeon]
MSSILKRLSRLREDWNRIISVSRKPDKNTFKLSTRVTILVLVLVGLFAYIIQLLIVLLHI